MSYSLKILINDCDRAFSSGNQGKFLRLRNQIATHIGYLKSEFLNEAVTSGNAKKCGMH